MIGGKVDFSLIQEESRKYVVELLGKIAGPKSIVWDKTLAGHFGLIGDTVFLRNNEVTKMYYLSSNKLPENNISNIIYIVRSSTEQLNLVGQQLRKEEISGDRRKSFYIWFVPHITSECRDYLEKNGTLGAFSGVNDLPIYMYKMETDLASMEMPLCYKELNLDDDTSSLFSIARALMEIQEIFGLIPSVYGKGTAAKKVFQMMISMRKELAGDEPQVLPQIDQLILIDRSVDLISVLATQLTYEGLIDQILGINNCRVKIPTERLPSEGDKQSLDAFAEVAETKSVLLNSQDSLYADLRDFNFSAVGPRLSVEAKNITSQFEERKQAKTVSEMKILVQKLPQMQVAKQSLATHTSLAELIQEEVRLKSFFCDCLQTEQEIIKGGADLDKVNPFIERCIFQKEPVEKVIHLMCLQSVVNNGLKPKVFEYLKKEIIQTYGFEHILTLENLEKAGLLTVQQTKSTYPTICKTLKLSVEDINEASPTDISYVHSGYAPLSVRLCELLQWPGWRAITEVLNILPGPTINETQQIPTRLRQRRNSQGSLHSSQSEANCALVVFIGGCTYAEISAFRFLSQKSEQGGPDYVILTTSMVNNQTFLQNLSQPLTMDL